jgi:hypothetical protein
MQFILHLFEAIGWHFLALVVDEEDLDAPGAHRESFDTTSDIRPKV